MREDCVSRRCQPADYCVVRALDDRGCDALVLIEKSYALRDPSFHVAVVVAKAEVDRVQDWHVKCVLGDVRLQLATRGHEPSTDNRRIFASPRCSRSPHGGMAAACHLLCRLPTDPHSRWNSDAPRTSIPCSSLTGAGLGTSCWLCPPARPPFEPCVLGCKQAGLKW